MATDATTAYQCFQELDPGAPRRCHSEAGLLAYVTVIGGAWAWTVWRGSEPVAGRRGYHMDVNQACEEALAALEAIKAGGEVTHAT